MKRLEKIIVVFIFLSLVMRLLLIPGGTMIFALSVPILAALYYPIGILYFNSISLRKVFKKESYEGLTFYKGVTAFGAGLIYSMLLIGVLFKLLQWPGALAMLTIGIAGSSVVSITFLIGFIAWKSSYSKDMLIRTVIILSISGIVFVTPSLTFVKIFYRNNPEYIEAYRQLEKDPQNIELQQKAQEALGNE